MKLIQIVSFSLIINLLILSNINADITYVSSQQEFDNAHDGFSTTDSIVWRSGTYSDIYMDINNHDLFISAEKLGGTIFTGSSRVEITGDRITLEGFQFLDGDIGTKDVINIRGSHVNINQINIRAYRSYKYLRVREESQYVDITHCNFENRLNLDDQNILSILVDDQNPGYHKIRYCSFKNFDGIGNDQGIEPIRIGLSTQADFVSRTLVEYCYFTQCNGDGEIISSKAGENVYRFNTFENNPKAELVLRHGSDAIVYSNFFLNGKGGVRVREGQNHYIYNNYFYNLDDRVIFLQNNGSDPLDNINIAFNTVVDCSEFILGGDGSNKPTDVTISNNIFSDPDDQLFEEETGTEKWIGNIAFGELGIPVPTSGLLIADPLLEKNSAGYFGLSESSPAIDAALSGYTSLPLFDGIDEIDTDVLYDLMGQNRPSVIEEKDLGCSEYPREISISPIATEENTGPGYNTSIITSLNSTPLIENSFIEINPNPVSDLLNITLINSKKIELTMEIFNIEGRRINAFSEGTFVPGQVAITKNVEHLPAGIYTLRAHSIDLQGSPNYTQVIKFIKSK